MFTTIFLTQVFPRSFSVTSSVESVYTLSFSESFSRSCTLDAAVTKGEKRSFHVVFKLPLSVIYIEFKGRHSKCFKKIWLVYQEWKQEKGRQTPRERRTKIVCKTVSRVTEKHCVFREEDSCRLMGMWVRDARQSNSVSGRASFESNSNGPTRLEDWLCYNSFRRVNGIPVHSLVVLLLLSSSQQ